MRGRARVAYIIPSMQVGGTETQLSRLMTALKDDFELALICTRAEGGLIGDVRRMGAYVRVLDARSGWDFSIGTRMRRILRGFNPHIVHTFMSGFDWQPNRIAHKLGVPVVISSRRELATWQKWRHRFAQRQANRYVDAIVANSQAVAEFAMRREGAPRELFHVIPNGIPAADYAFKGSRADLRTRFRMPLDRKIVGMVANFSPVKDHLLFVNMARELLKQRDDVHFLLVGSGPLVKHYGDLVQRRGLADYFNRVSTVTEVAEMYNMMDVFVLTSKMEGMPNALMEAMAAGRPIVASAVGGIQELLVHGETGRLVASRDPKAFAEQVAWCLDQNGAAQAMGEAAATHVRSQLSVEIMADRYRALYYELLDRKQAHRL